MNTTNSNVKKLAVATSMMMASGLAQAASIVNDNFDAGIGTWIQNTVDTAVVHAPAGGNPNGYLATRSSGPITAIGAQNTAAPYSGNFTDGLWTISVDLSFINGDFDDARLRYRYQDASFNGWYIVLEDTTFFDETWKSYSVTFDTTWDDATAMANGWVREDAVVPNFSTLWDNVYNSEVRISVAGDAVAGIDNYKAVGAVPVPAAVWLFGSGLLGLIGVARRKS